MVQNLTSVNMGWVKTLRANVTKLYPGFPETWQFSEKVEYLRQLGALDESNPDNLRVIIPNYVNGPSNCAASSSYYSVGCLNECDELLGHVEAKVASPDALPEQI